MVLVLQCLAIYALVCIVIMTVVVIKGFNAVVNSVPLGTRYDVFIANLLLVLLISPITLPIIVVSVIKELWKEIRDQCGEDRS
jgi:hypothetical protein